MEIAIETADLAHRLGRQNERETTLLALDNSGTVLGFAQLKRYSDRFGYRLTGETSIYLDRSRRGQGLGSVLQEALLERARTYGYRHLVAKVWASNEASLRFHKRFGYRLVGVQHRVGYLDDRWIDVAILENLLDDEAPIEPSSGLSGSSSVEERP